MYEMITSVLPISTADRSQVVREQAVSILSLVVHSDPTGDSLAQVFILLDVHILSTLLIQ